MISLNLSDIPRYKPEAKPFEKHDCKERGCFIPSPKNGVNTEKPVTFSEKVNLS